MYTKLKAHAGKLLANLSDLYLLGLITLGLPYAVYLFTGIEVAFTVFVLTQITLVIIWKRYN